MADNPTPTGDDGINAVLAVVERAEEGEYATKGRDFGRGVAYLAAEIRAALNGQREA